MPCFNGCAGPCYCVPYQPMCLPAPIEFWHTTGMIAKPSLFESSEQVTYFPDPNAVQDPFNAALDTITQMAGLGCVPGCTSQPDFAQTFAVNMCEGSTVARIQPVLRCGALALQLCLNTRNVAPCDVPLCGVDIRAVVTLTSTTGTVTTEKTICACRYEGLCNRGFSTVVIDLVGGCALPPMPGQPQPLTQPVTAVKSAIIFLKYRFADC